MECFISIEGAVAYSSSDDANNSAPVNRIVAWGSAHDCTALTVSITAGGTNFQVAANFPVPGGWVAEIIVAGSGLVCGEYADIDLNVRCDQNPACAATTKVNILNCQIEGGCPSWAKFSAEVVDASDAGCEDGKRLVRIEAQLPPDVPSGPGDIFAQLYIRPLESDAEIPLVDASASLQAGGLISVETRVVGGAYTYGLRIHAPQPCEGPIGVIEVPACPAPGPDDPALCPQITLGDVSVSQQCTSAQQRIVSASAVVSPEPGSPVSAQLVVMDGDTVVIVLDSSDDILDETVLSGNGPVSPGDYTIGVDVTDPQACNFSGQNLVVAICSIDDPIKPDKGESPTCPQIVLETIEVSEGCNDEGQRTVTATATLTPQPNEPTSAALVVMDGDTVVATLDSADGVTEANELSGSVDISPGDYSVVIRVTEPDGCDDPEETLTVAACGDDEIDGGGLQPPWCLIALIASLVIMILGAVIFGIAFCVVGFLTNPVSITIGIIAIVIGLVLLVIGNILFLIWLFTCGSCRLNCGHLNWLQFFFFTLAGGSLVLAALGSLLLISGASPLCFLGWFIDMVNFGILAALVTYWRKVVGCDTWPPGWPLWLRPTLPPALTNLCGR